MTPDPRKAWHKRFIHLFVLEDWMRQLNYVEKHISHGEPQASAVRYYFSGELLQTSNGMTTASMTPRRTPKDGKETHVENCGNQHALEQL
jgi:hypothetical protein